MLEGVCGVAGHRRRVTLEAGGRSPLASPQDGPQRHSVAGDSTASIARTLQKEVRSVPGSAEAAVCSWVL